MNDTKLYLTGYYISERTSKINLGNKDNEDFCGFLIINVKDPLYISRLTINLNIKSPVKYKYE